MSISPRKRQIFHKWKRIPILHVPEYAKMNGDRDVLSTIQRFSNPYQEEGEAETAALYFDQDGDRSVVLRKARDLSDISMPSWSSLSRQSAPSDKCRPQGRGCSDRGRLRYKSPALWADRIVPLWLCVAHFTSRYNIYPSTAKGYRIR